MVLSVCGVECRQVCVCMKATWVVCGGVKTSAATPKTHETQNRPTFKQLVERLDGMLRQSRLLSRTNKQQQQQQQQQQHRASSSPAETATTATTTTAFSGISGGTAATGGGVTEEGAAGGGEQQPQQQEQE